MICPNCRRETPDGMAFCFNCGAKLAAPSQVQQAQQQAQAAQQQAQQQAQEAQRQAQEQAQAAQRQAQEQARLAAEKAQREAAERAQREAAERAQREAAEKAQREAAEKAQREAAEKAQREAAEAQARAQREAQAKAQREAQAAQQQAQQAQQQAQQAAQNPYPYGPQFNQQPQQYGPQGPQQYGPQGPQQYGPQYGPQGQQYGPQGPQQFAPQPPKQPSAFEKLLSGEPNWLVNFYTKYYNFFLIICSLITIAFVGNAFAFRSMTGMTLSNLFLAGAAAGAAVFAQIMLTNKKFLGWIMTFVAAGLRFATVIVVMIGLFVIVDEYNTYYSMADVTTPLTLYNCFYSIVALMVQGALAAFAVILFLKNKDQYK